jgi:hypothetical protein
MGMKNVDPSIKKINTEVLSQTTLKDSILIYPLRPEVYLLTGRMPGSYYYFFLPWNSDNPGSEATIITDIKNKKVRLIIFQDDVKIRGKYQPTIFTKRIRQYLDDNPQYSYTKKNGLSIYSLR